jgi:hypothetical protein
MKFRAFAVLPLISLSVLSHVIFRDQAIKEIAREWLEEHNLPYK